MPRRRPSSRHMPREAPPSMDGARRRGQVRAGSTPTIAKTMPSASHSPACDVAIARWIAAAPNDTTPNDPHRSAGVVRPLSTCHRAPMNRRQPLCGQGDGGCVWTTWIPSLGRKSAPRRGRLRMLVSVLAYFERPFNVCLNTRSRLWASPDMWSPRSNQPGAPLPPICTKAPMPTVFVTGSTTGLGHATAEQLLDTGHQVVCMPDRQRAAEFGDLAAAQPES